MPPLIPILKNGQTEWIVDVVLKHRARKKDETDVRKMEFLIHWKGQTLAEDEWIPYANMADCRESISDYFKRQNLHWQGYSPDDVEDDEEE